MLRNFIFGWEECDLSIYRQAYATYGGSVCTHPDVLTYLSSKRNKEISSFAEKKMALSFHQFILLMGH
jgi:hypothetical protein